MWLMVKRSCAIFIGLYLMAGTACAALPDAVTFSWIVERGDINKVRSWLDAGLDPEFQDNQIGSGLMIAAWNGNVDMMALFVERGANPQRANRNGEQPLQLAAWNGHTPAVKWLLERGAPLNRQGNGWSALHYAVFNGHQELARYLIERGAEVNARSPNGATPLMLAAREGREELTRTLLESGADPRLKSDWGDNALTMAMRYEHYRLGKMISSPEEFAIAVKAPKETFGEPARSASAPSEIEQLLQKIREAEAEGQPSESLHAALRVAVNNFRQQAMARKASQKPMPLPYQPKSIVITAKRGNPAAERAQIMVNGKPYTPTVDRLKSGDQAGAVSVTPVKRATHAQIAELMRQIRLSEAQGRPATELRRQLTGLVDSLNTP